MIMSKIFRKIPAVKINIYAWVGKEKFENTIQYAVKNQNVAGVEEYHLELKRKYQGYQTEMSTLLEKESPALNEKFRIWERAENIKYICKLGTIIGMIFSLVNMFIIPATSITRVPVIGTIYGIIAILIIFLCPVAFIITILSKVICKMLKSKYDKCFELIAGQANGINGKYINEVSALWDKVDNLYLNFLDPTHRETVLMRRDQERHHQEAMRAQTRHQKVVEEEQRRTRKAQEEALSIERAREERYWRNR